MWSKADYHWMALAMQLGQKAMMTTDPNPRVGCVIVKGGKLIGQGWHQKAGENHAEINALDEAGDRAKGATVYVTLEPCAHQGKTPPCAEALIEAKISTVIVAMLDPNPLVAGQGIAQIQTAGIKTEIGLLAQDAQELNPGFIKRFTKKQPFIRIKTAMSLDGKTALSNGQSQWITGVEARADVQKLRARSSGILTGIGTVLADNPSLNVRDFDIGRTPMRIVLDSKLQMPLDAKMFEIPGQIVVVTVSEDLIKAEALEQVGAKVIVLPGKKSQVDLFALMSWLAEQQINELHVEAGATLSGALVQAGLVDELVVYMAAKVMGEQAKSLFNLNITKMSNTIKFKFADLIMIGEDLKLTLMPVE